MSIAFRCGCGRSLRAPAEMAGKKTKCPGCGKVVAIPAGNGEVAAGAPPQKAAAGTSPVVTCKCGKKIATKAEWAGKVIKCPGCGEKVKVPGGAATAVQAAAPKPAAAVAKSTTSKKRSRDDDDEDEDFDEDEEEERPKKKKKKKKKGSPVLWYALGGGGLLLVLIIVGIFMFMGRRSPPPQAKAKQPAPASAPAPTPEAPPPPPAGPSLVEFLPADAFAFLHTREGALMKSPSGKKLRALAPKEAEQAGAEIYSKLGIGRDDAVESALILMNAPNGPDVVDSSYVLMASTKPFKLDALEAGFQVGPVPVKFTKKELNGKPAYVLPLKELKLPVPLPDENMAIAAHLLNPNVLIVSTENGMNSWLGREVAKDGPLADSVKTVAAEPTFFFLAMRMPEQVNQFRDSPEAEQVKALLEANQLQLSLQEDKTIRLGLRLKFPDAEKATKGKETIENLLGGVRLMAGGFKKGLPPGGDKIVDAALASIKPTANADTVDVPVQINTTIGELAELSKPMIDQIQAATLNAKQQGEILKGQNNLKELVIGMHNHHSAKIGFPIYDPKKLSWRVALLPYIEASELAGQFNADEPWDSEQNQKLLPMMPKVFEIPTRPGPPGHTYFRVFTGRLTAFPEATQTKLQDMKDGTANTLLIVEAQTAVPWTKPDELAYDPNKPLPKLGDPLRGGVFLAAFADGMVKFLPPLDDKTLAALITIQGGEPPVNLPTAPPPGLQPPPGMKPPPGIQPPPGVKPPPARKPPAEGQAPPPEAKPALKKIMELEEVKVEPSGNDAVLDFTLANRSDKAVKYWVVKVDVFDAAKKPLASGRTEGADLPAGGMQPGRVVFADRAATNVASWNLAFEKVMVDDPSGRLIDDKANYRLVTAKKP